MGSLEIVVNALGTGSGCSLMFQRKPQFPAPRQGCVIATNVGWHQECSHLQLVVRWGPETSRGDPRGDSLGTAAESSSKPFTLSSSPSYPALFPPCARQQRRTVCLQDAARGLDLRWESGQRPLCLCLPARNRQLTVKMTHLPAGLPPPTLSPDY